MTQTNNLSPADLYFILFGVALVLFLVTGIVLVILLGHYVKLKRTFESLSKTQKPCL